MALTPGTRVGPYEITAVIGAGGMGEVYRARDARLRRDVALEVSSRVGPRRGGLLREAQAASALNHPNVCHVYDVGESEHGDWIAMEFVPGERLDRRIPPVGLPPETVIRFADQIAAALAHAHARGIIHRDLKTANCALGADGEVKVLDFGLATRSLTQLGQEVTQSLSHDSANLVGTPAYMAPEIIRGQRADERSDLWALGVIMYELATGRRPFAGSTGYEVTSSVLTEPLEPLPASLPESLRAIVTRLLEKDSSRRYQSADEVRTALDIGRVGTHTAVKPSAPLAIGRRGALVGTGLVVLAALGWWWAGRERPLQVSDVELLSTFDGSHSAPAISPAGDLVAFIAPDAERVPQVWIKNLKEGPPIQITSGAVPAERPRWHPASGDRRVCSTRPGAMDGPRARRHTDPNRRTRHQPELLSKRSANDVGDAGRPLGRRGRRFGCPRSPGRSSPLLQRGALTGVIA